MRVFGDRVRTQAVLVFLFVLLVAVVLLAIFNQFPVYPVFFHSGHTDGTSPASNGNLSQERQCNAQLAGS